MRTTSLLAAFCLAAATLIAACIVTTPPANPPPGGGPPVTTNPTPGPECAATECGPAMGMPAGKCPDGSASGPTGRCLRQADGRCGWEVRQCPPAMSACVRTGCSGTVCADKGQDVMTICDMRPEYECFQTATCERQADGACGWTRTAALSQCLTSKAGKQ
jgi:eight-cysteine-cluster-containing protein